MVEEVAGPRDIDQAVLTTIFPSGVLATALRVSSSITTVHYVPNKDLDPKRSKKGKKKRKFCTSISSAIRHSETL